MLFDAIFLTLFFLTWCLLGALPWIVLGVRRRAYGAIWALPFALLGGAGGGVLVPVLGVDTGAGIGVSMATAFVGGALLSTLAYQVWDQYALGRRFAPLAVRDDEVRERRIATALPADPPPATSNDPPTP